MVIYVRLHDILIDKVQCAGGFTRGCTLQELPEGSPVSDLLRALHLDRKLVGLIVVNGRQAGPDHTLRNGDHVSLFSPMSGG